MPRWIISSTLFIPLLAGAITTSERASWQSRWVANCKAMKKGSLRAEKEFKKQKREPTELSKEKMKFFRMLKCQKMSDRYHKTCVENDYEAYRDCIDKEMITHTRGNLREYFLRQLKDTNPISPEK